MESQNGNGYSTQFLVEELRDRVVTRGWGRKAMLAYTDILGLNGTVPTSTRIRATGNDLRRLAKKYFL